MAHSANDLELDLGPPIARSSDPVTSKAGALAYTESGQRTNDKQAVLEVIRAHPGKTCRELAYLLKEAGTLHWISALPTVTKRISDLIADDKIVTGMIRRCSKSKRHARTYYVAPDHL